MRLIITCAGLAFILFSIRLSAAEPNVGGIGVALGTDSQSKAVKIVRVLPNGPAAQADVPAGGLLHKIGETVVDGKSINDCTTLIRGPVGSKLALEVIDPGTHATNRFELTRAQIDAAASKARLGDPAAPLSIKEWVQGGPVNVKDGKAIYVVEFWATWCGPCRVSIPRLNALQKRLKDKGVVVVGISDEEPSKVKAFVSQMGTQMEYAVACDDSLQTNAGYTGAYGYRTIPTAFIVGKNGRVIWHGNPLVGLEKAVEDILAKEKL